MDATELVNFFRACPTYERWIVMHEREGARLCDPNGSEGDIVISYSWADYLGLRHGRAFVAVQLAEMFARCS